MKMAFPLEYLGPKEFVKMRHIQSSVGIPLKIGNCEYFSCSSELIFNSQVSPEIKEENQYGYFGLPGPREVALDLMAMLPDSVEHQNGYDKNKSTTFKTSEIIKGLEVEQYFHASDVPRILKTD